MNDQVKDTKQITLPSLSFKTIWMLSFAFFGVQMGFSLQSSNLGRLL